MTMWGKSFIAGAAMLAGIGAANATIININSVDGTGVTLALAAGNYQIRLIGTADGGAYDGWNAWGGNLDCDQTGGNCQNGYIEQFGYDLGTAGMFDNVNGRYFALAPTNMQTYRYSTGLQALGVYQTMIEGAPLTAQGYTGYTSVALPIRFNLAAPQSVKFFIGDSNYAGNIGGVSLALTVPEPASWALMLAGFGIIGATLRRTQRAVTA